MVVVAMAKIIYCRCAFANVVPEDVKDEVLQGLCESGESFETVPDLCEMSARKDPKLRELVEEGTVKIAACYPRAVRWLFHSAEAGFSEEEGRVSVHNMREESSEKVLRDVLDPEA